jgi:hypothetical protein
LREKKSDVEAKLWKNLAKKHQREINKWIKEGLNKKLKIIKDCLVKGGRL